MSDRKIKILLIAIPLTFVAIFVYDRIDFGSKNGIIKTAEAHPVNKTVLVDTTNKEYLKMKLVNIYSGEIGVRELTGNNDGERVEEYLASCGLSKGYAWCAAYVNWCYNGVGIKGGGAYSPNWFPNAKTIYTNGNRSNKMPAQCDVFGVWFNDKNRIAHVGFIDKWTDGGDYCITVEGNTNDGGSRDGDGVYRKRRLKSQVYKVSRWL